MLLLVAAGVAVVWANSPWSHAYRTVSDFAVGPDFLHLRLSLSAWVVDDLLAITVIAVFFTDTLSLGPLALALIPGALTRKLAECPGRAPCRISASASARLHTRDSACRVRNRTLGATFIVHRGAFFAAGVAVGGWSGLGDSLTHPIALGVIAGLVIGKPLGVWLTAYLLAKFAGATLDDDLTWRDVLGVALPAGIGFTVSLLIGELAFGHGTTAGADV